MYLNMFVCLCVHECVRICACMCMCHVELAITLPEQPHLRHSFASCGRIMPTKSENGAAEFLNCFSVGELMVLGFLAFSVWISNLLLTCNITYLLLTCNITYITHFLCALFLQRTQKKGGQTQQIGSGVARGRPWGRPRA